MSTLQKQMKVIHHKIWYYQTALEAGTEDIHKNISCQQDIENEGQ